MSVHECEDDRLEPLLAAQLLGELDAAARARLERRAAEQGRLGAVEANDRLLGCFAAERELRTALSAPAEPREEADPVFARMEGAAARAEHGLRGQLGAGLTPALQAARPRRRWRRWLAAAVLPAVALTLWALSSHGTGPADDLLLGPAARILMEPELSLAVGELSWHPVVGARRYDAVIVDAEGAPLLTRSAAHAASTRWKLTPDEIARLRAHRGTLGLRVVARDGSGIAIATTGDLTLRLR